MVDETNCSLNIIVEGLNARLLWMVDETNCSLNIIVEGLNIESKHS